MSALSENSGQSGCPRISPRQWLLLTAVFMAASGIFLLSERRQAQTWGFPLDDSWIHCRYAQNLTRGLGFSFNPGEPSNGSTAPLWTLAVAAAYAITGEFPLTLKLMGVVMMWGCCVLTVYIILQMLGKPNYALAGGMAVVLMPTLIGAALSGMETALYPLLVVAAIYTYLRNKGKAGWSQFLPTLLLAAGVATRPELGTIFIFLLLDHWISGRAQRLSRRRIGREIALHVVLFCLLLLPYGWYNWRVTGLPYPSTYTAKVSTQWGAHQVAARFLLDPWRAVSSELTTFAKLNPVIALLFPLGLFRLLLERRRGWLLICLSVIGYPVIRKLVAPFGEFDFQGSRYYMHCFPLAVILATVGLAQAAAWAQQHRLNPRRLTSLAAVIIVLAYAPAVWTITKQHGLSVKNITEMQVHLGQWLASNTAEDALIATNDIGAIAVFSQRKILDMVGLVNPAVQPYVKPQGSYASGIGYEKKGLLEYLQRKRPDYLVVFPAWYPELVTHREFFEPIYQVKLRDNYICGSNEMVVYRTKFAKNAP